jgi:diguanylate cyclase (GGDEF)-like protein/PAS domain S-box-containing protein
MHQKSVGGNSRTSSSPLSDMLRQFADSDEMIVWVTDADDVCIYLNKTQFSPNEIAQLRIHDWLRCIHPGDLGSIQAQFNQARNTLAEYRLEYRVVKSDGTVRWVLGSGAPRFTEAGEFAGYNGTILDITEQRKTIERLTRSEAEYRLLAENSSDLICHCGPDGSYLYVSPSYSRAIGIDALMLLGKDVYDYVHPDDRESIQHEVQRQIETGTPSRLIEIRKRHQDGRYIWMGTKIQVMIDPVTKIKRGTVSISRDISLERQIRNELTKSEARFRGLTQLSADWYWETDEEHRLTFVSDGLWHAIRIAPEEVLGKRREDYAIDPDNSHLSTYLQKVANREPFKNLLYSGQHPETGRIFHASVSGEPVFIDNRFIGYRGVSRDVTAERKMLHQLERLAGENRALIENSLDIIALLDDEGRFLRVSEAVHNILGYRPDEVLGRRYADFVHPEELQRIQAVDAELRTGDGIIQNFETRWLRKDGSIAHLSISARWASDEKVMYVTARDISESFQTRAELHRTNVRLNTILESIGDAFFSLGKDWRVTYVNRKTAEFAGIERGSAIGKLFWEVVPHIVHSPIFARYQHAMLTGENAFFEAYYEPANAWVDIRAYPHEEGLSVFFNDITSRRENERAIRENEQRIRQMIETAPAGYIATDANGILREINPALCALTGYTEDEFVGKNIQWFLPTLAAEHPLQVSEDFNSLRRETTIQHKQGHRIYVLVDLMARRDDNGNLHSLAAFVIDLTERKQVENQLEYLATHDMLTGLPNRVYINRQLQNMLDSAQPNNSIAVLFIDLDRFKDVNDSLGHAPGDALLRQVARRLQSIMRAGDMVARLGGDEFVVAVHCTDGKKSAAVIAEKILATLTQPFDIEGQEIFVSASIGISMFAEDARTKELLFQNADTAMYRAKSAGRDSYRFFETAMSEETKKRMVLEHALRHALEQQELELYYQPRVDLKTMQVVGLEALVRWHHAQLGTIGPTEFIPIAEDKGLIVPIGQWVLEQACRHGKYLIDKFAMPLQISVNLSAHQLKCRDLIDQVTQALSLSQFPPEMLELELTESALIEDMDLSAHILKRLKHFGILLSVDDFGTGYSSLSYLKRFPVDILKLDRSFVLQQPEDISSFDFVKAFVDMAHALKLSVVAEGIESDEILQLLTASRCDEGQGYLFAKPMTLQDLEQFLTQWSPKKKRTSKRKPAL